MLRPIICVCVFASDQCMYIHTKHCLIQPHTHTHTHTHTHSHTLSLSLSLFSSVYSSHHTNHSDHTHTNCLVTPMHTHTHFSVQPPLPHTHTLSPLNPTHKPFGTHTDANIQLLPICSLRLLSTALSLLHCTSV